MRIEPRRAEAVLQAPGPFQAILLYGEDVGLLVARSDLVTRVVAGSLDDPFRVALLERETHSRLGEEAAALAMTGGRRVVRVRDATDGLTGPLQAALEANSACLIVLEAPGLPSKSRLRIAAERHPAIAAIACYPEDSRSLEATVRGVLSEGQVGIESDALAWVLAHLGADQAQTRREVEKLALYCGPRGTADLAAAQACIGDAAAISLEDALFAATAGDVEATDRALGQAMAEGSAPVAVLRAALSHLQRLQKARLGVAEGVAPDEVTRALRPPLFFRRQEAFLRSLTIWRPTDLAAAIDAVFVAEQKCKRTAAPAEAITMSTILTIARRAAQLLRLSRG
jgi:DNA polymerase-3 subunit delta